MVTILLVLIYLAFISLGLPDGLFGAAWPIVREGINLPQEMGGIYAAIMSIATIISSLFASRLIAKLGTGKVLVISVFITSASLLIFPLNVGAFIPVYPYMCVAGFVLGLGAGAVDAALNNYVALHFKAMHMSFLHCFWGLGCMISPMVLSVYLTHGGTWQGTYYTIGIAQAVLAVVLIFSIPMWAKVPVKPEALREGETVHLTNRETLKLPLIKTSALAFFCYCGYENAMILWVSSYANEVDHLSVEIAALFASIFFAGITGGRFISGILSVRIGMKNLARYGCIIAFIGMLIVFLPFGKVISGIGVVMVGAGAGPFYPALMYRTPESFGAAASQSAIGLQMACAYTGSTLVPAFLGTLPLEIFPICELILIALTFILSESLNYRKKKRDLAINDFSA
ncbi:MAG: MFS transporter [Ruminococcus sp.]|jgi:fucose permease|nr:MFS transporter [Ruminococcus sp.]